MTELQNIEERLARIEDVLQSLQLPKQHCSAFGVRHSSDVGDESNSVLQNRTVRTVETQASERLLKEIYGQLQQIVSGQVNNERTDHILG